MAIKGKGKTKGRQPARAPRRAPVEVKPPFFLRRRVQVALAFVVGILAMLLAIWITNGLRKQQRRREGDDRRRRSSERPAEQWKTQVESALGKVGTISPGAPPAVFPDLATTITALQKGSVPDGAAATLTTGPGRREDRDRSAQGVQAVRSDPRHRDDRRTGLLVPELPDAVRASRWSSTRRRRRSPRSRSTLRRRSGPAIADSASGLQSKAVGDPPSKAGATTRTRSGRSRSSIPRSRA